MSELKAELRPLSLGTAWVSNGRAHLRRIDGTEFSIEDELAPLIAEVLFNASGNRSVEEIAALVTVSPRSDVERVLALLLELGLVIESHLAFRSLARVLGEPTLYPPPHLSLSEIAELPKAEPTPGASFRVALPNSSADLRRGSTRAWDPRHLQFEELAAVIPGCYDAGEGVRPTPSAGGFYSVEVFIAALRVNGLDPGLYRYTARSDSIEAWAEARSLPLAYRSINTSSNVDPAAILFFAADLEGVAAKYGNRCLSLVLTEVGCITEAIQLIAFRNGFGSLPLGGVSPSEIMGVLGLDHAHTFLGGIALGAPAVEDGLPKCPDFLQRLDEVRCAPGQPDGAQLLANDGPVRSPYWHTTVSIAGDDDARVLCGGSGKSQAEAEYIARVELIERFAASQARIDRYCTAVELGDDQWIDPRVACPLSDSQRKTVGLVPFDPRERRGWVRGERMLGGARVWAPVDLVFMGPPPDNPNSALTSTSGVASHELWDRAAANAFMELIERDALMVRSASRMTPDEIHIPDLGEGLLRMCALLEETSWRIRLFDFTIDSFPVVVATSWGDVFPHFLAGAACRISLEEAAISSVRELFSMLTPLTMTGKETSSTSPDAQPARRTGLEAHMMRYAESVDAAHSLNWLTEGGRAVNRGPIAYEDALARFNPAVFDLDTEAPRHTIRSARVISEGLVPIVWDPLRYLHLHDRLRKYAGEDEPQDLHFFG